METTRKLNGTEGWRQQRQRQSVESRIDEVRSWLLICEWCQHDGWVDATLRQLRHAKLTCSECGRVRDKRK